MKNLNLLILGGTGAGKTTLARYLLAMTPRAFVFDPADDYDDGAIFYDFEAAAEFFERNAREDFHLIYRGDRSTYEAWLDILYEAQRHMQLPPLGVFLEESSYYSTSHNITPLLDQIYTKGRRQRISIVTVTQRDTQVNPIIRSNSHVWITMRQRKFSTDVKETFTSDELEQIQNLETFTPLISEPVEGTHFMIDQPGLPVFEKWREIVGGELV